MKIGKLILMLFIAHSGFAFQQLPLQELEARLQNYYAKNTPLKVNLVSNQPLYLAGESLFYKATVTVAESFRNLAGTNLLNVLLIDHRQQIVVNQKIRLKEGNGINQLVIPPAAVPGRYLLVAYHDWMK